MFIWGTVLANFCGKVHIFKFWAQAEREKHKDFVDLFKGNSDSDSPTLEFFLELKKKYSPTLIFFTVNRCQKGEPIKFVPHPQEAFSEWFLSCGRIGGQVVSPKSQDEFSLDFSRHTRVWGGPARAKIFNSHKHHVHFFPVFFSVTQEWALLRSCGYYPCGFLGEESPAEDMAPEALCNSTR